MLFMFLTKTCVKIKFWLKLFDSIWVNFIQSNSFNLVEMNNKINTKLI